MQIRVEGNVVATAAAGEIRYSTQTTHAGLMRAELPILAIMISKVREEIEVERKREGEAVLSARIAAGHMEWFTPGILSDPKKGTT